MSNEIIKILDAVCDKFGMAIDWTAENVMPQVEQIGEHIVQYELWSSSLWTMLALVVLIVGTIVCGKKIKSAFKYGEGDTILEMGIIMVIVYFIFVPVLLTQSQDVIAALTFPEKTILDFITTYTQN